MVPEGAVDEARIPVERQIEDEGSNTSSPEPALVTPVSRDMARVSIKEESPTPIAARKRPRSPVAGPSGTSNVQPKKKMRVAFA
jgi:hypothetical protein